MQIGRLLLINSTTVEQEERLFEIVNHLNIGHSLMATPQERENLAQLNLLAGRKAKTSTAYGAAIEYLTAGIYLLPPDSWERHYDLTMSLHQEITEAAYLNADYEHMERWATPVLQHAKTLLEKFKIAETKIMAVRGQGQILVALRMGLDVLQSLGIEFPESPTQKDIEQAFRETRQLWEDRPPLSLLDLPVMDDPVRLAAMRMFMILGPSAYSADPAFMPLLTCKGVEFSIQYGNCPISSCAYAEYGMLLCGVVGHIESGYEFGQLALKAVKRFDAIQYKCRTEMLVHLFISHWKEPLHHVLPHLLEAYRSGLTTGDLEAASYSAQVYCLYSYFTGKELSGLAGEMEAYCQTFHLLKQETALKYQEITQQTVLNLLGATLAPWELTGTVYNAEQSLPLLQANSNLTALFHFHFNQTILYYLFGRHSLAAQHSALMEKYLDSTPGQFMITLYSFYDSLIHLALYDETTEEQKGQIRKRVRKHQAKMRRWAEMAPFNHQHRWELVEAELYRVLGKHLEAMELYDHAIRSANINGYIQDEALANELAARFYLGCGREKVAQAYLQEAYSGYTRWGAKAKAAHLERHYNSLPVPVPDSPARLPRPAGEEQGLGRVSANLDLVTIVKASQAIAGEIELDRLLKQMMLIVLENAGAQHGALILERNGEWVIEAQADVDCEINVLQAQNLRESPVVSAEIVSSVARSHTSIVLDDAARTGDFPHDPSIIQRGVKSVLCVPLLNQGRLSGMVYLENNLITSAFTAERLELLNLLSTQMALSLDNARLYQDAQHELAERKQAEEEKAKLEEQLIQAQKMESIGRLAGGVAHDFNNMLTIILGYAEFLKSELQSDASLLKYVEEIEKAGMHSRDITRQLLAFSRKQIIAPKTINLNGLIESTNKTLARLIGEDVELQFYPEKELWKVKFDPSQIDQILINLAVNAHDAMPDGGVLTITTANVYLDEAYCRENIESKTGQFVLLEITDSGFGMDKETIPHIFEPFFTTKEVGKGTGLGLATVYGIVKQNNGFINLYSEPGLGTTFKIYIPRFLEEGETEEKIVEPSLSAGVGTILLVEDDNMVRDMTTAMLETIGYKVLNAATPSEALSLCAKKDTLIDLLITDVVMPKMNGPELKNKIEAILPGIKVLFMSGYTSNVIVHHGVLEDGLHFIQKPFSMKDLARKVRYAMESK